MSVYGIDGRKLKHRGGYITSKHLNKKLKHDSVRLLHMIIVILSPFRIDSMATVVILRNK